jgi:hypothetical protein
LIGGLVNIKKLGLLGLSAAGLIIAIFLVILTFHWPFSQTTIQQSVQSTFPGTVTFQNFHHTYFPHPGCTGDNLQFKQAGASSSAPPLVTIRHFSIAAHYLDLLFRPGYIARIVLNDFHIHVPAERLSLERPTDSSNSSILVGEIIADGSSIQIDRDSDSPLFFDIHTLRLAPASESTPFSYTTTLHIPLPSGELRSNGKFGPWNLNNPGQTAVSGDFAFENADLGVFKGIAGTLSSEAKFQGVLSNIEAHGKINIPNFGVTRSHHSVHLQSAFHAYIDGTNGDVRLEHVEASYFKTKVTAEGEVAHHSGQDGKIASIDLFVSNGRIQDVLYLFVRAPDPPLHGLASFRAHVSIPPKEQPFVEKIRIIGDFEIENGQFAKASTQESIDTLSERARGVKPENENDSDKVISNLAGHVDLRNASAALTDLRFHVPGASAHMDGTYNIESTKINLHGTLRTDEEFSNLTTGVKSVLLRPFDSFFRKKHAGAVIPIHLLGTFGNPLPGLDFPDKDSPPKQSPVAH